jgi:ABC-type uncharacterized transport system substrate-binding protein
LIFILFLDIVISIVYFRIKKRVFRFVNLVKEIKTSVVCISLWVLSVLFFSIRILAESVPIILPSYNPYYKKVVSGFQKTFLHPTKIYYLSSQTEKENEGIMNEIRATSPPFIITIGEEASTVAKHYITEVPIIFSMVHSAKIFEMDNNNFCGIETDTLIIEYFKLLKKIKPQAKKIYTFYTTEKSESIINKAMSEDIYYGILLEKNKIEDKETFSTVLNNIPKGSVDAILMVNDPIYNEKNFLELSEYCKKNKILLFALYPALVDLGATLTLIPDYKRLGSLTAELGNQLYAKQISCSIGPISKFHNYLLYVNEKYSAEAGMELSDSIKKKTQTDRVLMAGIELFDKSMYKSARKVFEKLVEEEPDNELANYYLQQIIFEQTKERISTLMKKGEELSNKKQYEMARKVYSEILVLNPGYKEATEKYNDSLKKENEAYIQEASRLDKSGNPFQAIQKLNLAIRLYPVNPKAKSMLGLITGRELKNLDTYLQEGISFYTGRRYDRSIHSMENILLIDSTNKTANEYLRLSKIKQEAYKKLQECANKPNTDKGCILIKK